MTKEHRGALVITGIKDKVGTAVPVPEHGRLIDADTFENFIRKDWDKNCHWIADVVYSRPTIIPASEEEGANDS